MICRRRFSYEKITKTHFVNQTRQRASHIQIVFLFSFLFDLFIIILYFYICCNLIIFFYNFTAHVCNIKTFFDHKNDCNFEPTWFDMANRLMRANGFGLNVSALNGLFTVFFFLL